MAPERVASIVLNDVGPELASAGLARIRSYAGRPASARSWAAAGAAVRTMIGDVLPGLDDERWIVLAHRMWREAGDGTIVPDYDPAVTGSPQAGDTPAAPRPGPCSTRRRAAAVRCSSCGAPSPTC